MQMTKRVVVGAALSVALAAATVGFAVWPAGAEPEGFANAAATSDAEPDGLENAAAAASDVAPGDDAELPVKFRGTADGTGVVVKIHDDSQVPKGVEYSNCDYPDKEPGTIVCAWPEAEVAEGEVYGFDAATPFTMIGVDDEAPGPLDVCRTCEYEAAVDAEKAEYWLDYIGGDMSQPAKLATDSADGSEEWAETSPIDVVSAANSADLEVTGTRVDGELGDEAEVELAVRNLDAVRWMAPDDDPRFKVTLPTGTKVADPGDSCGVGDSDRELTCALSEVVPESSRPYSFTVEITSADPAADGEVVAVTAPDGDSWYDTDLDDNPDNNSAAVTVHQD